MIKVSSASSLFQEKGLDTKGIFTLLLNAIERENLNVACLSYNSNDGSDILNPWSSKFSDCRVAAVSLLLRELEHFSPDLGYAQKRIAKFFADYANLKKIRSKMDDIGFWDMLFKKRREYRSLAKDKAEIENMMLSTNDLLNVAFFHYNQRTNKVASEFIKDLKCYLEVEQEKYM